MPSSREIDAALNLAFSTFVTKLFNVLMTESANVGAQRDVAYTRFIRGLHNAIELYDRIEKEVKHDVGD